MAVVGMDPKTVYPASSKLQNASTTLNHAVTSAMGALDNPGDIPQDFASRALAIGGQARTCLTSADAFAVHSVDLLDRAKLFEVLEGYSPMTAASRGAALDHFKLLWNPAGRHRSMLEPGDYYNEVDTILHPERHQPPPGPKKPNGCEVERGGEGELNVPGLHIKKDLEGEGPNRDISRTNFNTPGEHGQPGRPGSGPVPLGGRDRPDYKDNDGTLLDVEGGGSYEQKIGVKCTTDLGHGVGSESEVKDYAEVHATGSATIGRHGADLSVEAGASAGVQGSEKLTTKYGSAEVTAGGKVGITAGGGVHAQLDDGHLRVGGKVSLAFGLGFSLGGDLDINLGGILGHGHHDAPKPGVPIGSHGSDGSAVISNAVAPAHGGASGGGGGGAS